MDRLLADRTTTGDNRGVRIACCQLDAKTMDSSAAVWPALEGAVERAANRGADCCVLPEIAYPAYFLESVERYRRSNIERSDRVLARFAALAERHGVWVVGGYVEECGTALFNSAAVIDASGAVVAVARKQFMWDCDQDWFTPGDESLVVPSPWGAMGLQICADLRLPEISASLAHQGAEFIVQPTAWVNAALVPGAFDNIQPDFLLRARALEFGVPVASCSKSGRETPAMGYVGQSTIADAAGESLARAPIEGDAVVLADIEPRHANRVRLTPAERDALRADGECASEQDPSAELILHATDPVGRCEDRLRQCGARVARVEPQRLASFVEARVAALRGVQVVLTGPSDLDLSLLRARAAENRIFVVVADDTGLHHVVTPMGRCTDARKGHADSVSIRPTDANVKRFTPRTPIWSQRRARSYSFL